MQFNLTRTGAMAPPALVHLGARNRRDAPRVVPIAVEPAVARSLSAAKPTPNSIRLEVCDFTSRAASHLASRLATLQRRSAVVPPKHTKPTLRADCSSPESALRMTSLLRSGRERRSKRHSPQTVPHAACKPQLIRQMRTSRATIFAESGLQP